MTRKATAAAETASIVIVGPISPSLFQPRWLASQGLISKPEAEAVQNLVVTPDFSQFETEWLQLNSVGNKLTLTTKLEPYFAVLRDLAASLLTLFEYTPIAAVGLNRIAHFNLNSPDEWHKVGHLLAPKLGIWDDILVNPGTRRVAIEGERQNRPGAVNVVVEPSSAFANSIFVEVNDHFASPEWPQPSLDWADEVITTEWTAHEKVVDRVFERLTSLSNLATDRGEQPNE